MKRDGMVPWPPEVARGYIEAGYWRQRPLAAFLAGQASPATAVVDGPVRLTYQELSDRVDLLAESLAARGMADGDNILVQLPNCWQFVVLFLACQRIGVAPVLALPTYRQHEMNHLAKLAKVAAVVVPGIWRGFDHHPLARSAAAAAGRACQVLGLSDVDELLAGPPRPGARERLDARAPDPADAALFLLSGGTTGLPKIIGRTHDDYDYNIRRSGEVCEFSAETVYLAALPIAHNFTLGSPGVLATLMNRGRVVIVGSPSPDAVFTAIERERVTVASVVPAVARRWLSAAAGRDLSSLRFVQIGGSVVEPELARAIVTGLGCGLQQVFGMAEGLLNYTRPDDPPDVVLTTQGRPICPDDELLIVDEQDRPVVPGTAGELLTRGPYTPRGYFAAPAHNAVAYTADGWYRTGDLVRLHPSGNLVVAGRRKDVINRGGEKISAAEVESLVSALPEVAAVAAIPAPHGELGECVCVCVVLGPDRDLTLTDIRAALTERGVAEYKLPERLEVLPCLPLTPIGKVDKKALRGRIVQAAEVY